MAVRNLPEEKELRKNLREVRDNLKKLISAFDDDGLEVDNLHMAIRHQYSVMARLEEELDTIPSDESLVEELEALATSKYDKIAHKEYTTIPTVEYNKMLNLNKRLEAKLNRVTILRELARVNRLLGQQAGQQALMDEQRAKTEHIKIETHAAVLQAMKDIFYLALRRLGKPDSELQALAREMMRIERDYPIIQEDYKRIKSRLFGMPEDVPKQLEAEYEIIDDPITELNRLANEGPVRKAKKR